MEPTTVADRIAASALTTEGMPLGQRCLRAGLKPIDMAQMRAHFACDKFQEAQNRLVKDKLIADFCEAQGLTGAQFGDKYVVVEDSHQFVIYDKKVAPKKPESVMTISPLERIHSQILSGWGGLTFAEDIPGDDRASKKVCKVEIKALETYLDAIPDRVLQSHSAARELGIKQFCVAQPVLEDAPRPPDPILLGKIGEQYVEIDCWE